MQSRRSFVRRSSLGMLSGIFSYNNLFGINGTRIWPNDLNIDQDIYQKYSKHPDMTLLNDRPINMEAKAHLLTDSITPADKLFIRNNGLIPEVIDPNTWTLSIGGESVIQAKTYTLSELKEKFPLYSYQLTLECGGNGRSEFNPPAKGNQWTIGAVGCAKWTGVRLRDLLQDAGIKEDAVYIGYYGADKHLSGDPEKVVISRGIPLQKAMMDETLVAFAMNDEPIPVVHGYPLRLVAGGWPASASGKWLNKLVVRNQVHDGPKMGGQSYRVPCDPVPPGAKVEDKDMCIIESMPVKSIITSPKSGAILSKNRKLEIAGHAWAGELEVTQMHYSVDFGRSWKACALNKPVNRLAWQQWNAMVSLPGKGYYEIWARATDSYGQMQPMLIPGWNPKGYLNNACHRIAVRVE